MFQRRKEISGPQMDQAEDTLSDISDFIETLIKGKEDILSVKGTNSLFKLIVQILECLYI